MGFDGERGNTGNFNTTGAACYRTNANINGWGCYNFEGRTLTVGGVARTCGQMPLTGFAELISAWAAVRSAGFAGGGVWWRRTGRRAISPVAFGGGEGFGIGAEFAGGAAAGCEAFAGGAASDGGIASPGAGGVASGGGFAGVDCFGTVGGAVGVSALHRHTHVLHIGIDELERKLGLAGARHQHVGAFASFDLEAVSAQLRTQCALDIARNGTSFAPDMMGTVMSSGIAASPAVIRKMQLTARRGGVATRRDVPRFETGELFGGSRHLRDRRRSRR